MAAPRRHVNLLDRARIVLEVRKTGFLQGVLHLSGRRLLSNRPNHQSSKTKNEPAAWPVHLFTLL